jgi:hypothetical protein
MERPNVVAPSPGCTPACCDAAMCPPLEGCHAWAALMRGTTMDCAEPDGLADLHECLAVCQAECGLPTAFTVAEKTASQPTFRCGSSRRTPRSDSPRQSCDLRIF